MLPLTVEQLDGLLHLLPRGVLEVKVDHDRMRPASEHLHLVGNLHDLAVGHVQLKGALHGAAYFVHGLLAELVLQDLHEHLPTIGECKVRAGMSSK